MSGRPWIEHDGGGCPFSEGTMVERMYRNGVVETTAVGDLWPNQTEAHGSAWIWPDDYDPQYEVIAYRLSDTDDKAKREARMAEFTRIADEGLKTDAPVKAPQKVGVDQ